MMAESASNYRDTISRQITTSIANLKGDAIRWNQDLKVWIVTGLRECEFILANDDLFQKNTVVRPDGVQFWGRRHLSVMNGDDQRHLHAMLMRETGKAFSVRVGQTVVQPVADLVAQEVAERPAAELVSEYADLVPLRIGCEYLGIKLDGSSFDRLSALRSDRDIWKEVMLGYRDDQPGTARDAGEAAIRAMRELVMPTIRARRDKPEGDLISGFWQGGRKIFADWDEDDVIALCWTYLDGGELKHLIRNLLFILCTSRELRLELKRSLGESGSTDAIKAFVEEGLRHLTPLVSAGDRIAVSDTEVGNVTVRASEVVRPVLPAANRDEAVWHNPDQFIGDRADADRHVSFGRGRHYCVGRYLARLEATEAVAALLRLPVDFALDPMAPQPCWRDEFTRSVSPIHVRFGPL